MSENIEAEAGQSKFYDTVTTMFGHGMLLDISDVTIVAEVCDYGTDMASSLLLRAQDREELTERGVAIKTEKYRGSRLYFDENFPPTPEDRARAITQIDKQTAANIARFLLNDHDEGPRISYEE